MLVTKLDACSAPKLEALLLEQGFILAQPPYTQFVGKKNGVTCSLYCSGKLVVQGKAALDFIEFYLEPQILQNFDFTYKQIAVDRTPHIGVDEAGKGDVFGALCVAAVHATENQCDQLQQCGVKDSKNLADAKVLVIASKVRQICLHKILVLSPAKYNALYASFGNLNTLLAWGHATVIEDVVGQSGCRTVLIDQFAAESVVIAALKKKAVEVTLTQRHRGEEDIVVAAASILARAAFLENLASLGQRLQITLPKGAAQQTITMGRSLVQKYGSAILNELIKLHFKTTQAILN